MSIIAVALVAALAADIKLELPAASPVAGSTLFARAVLSATVDTATVDRGSAYAELNGTRFRLHVEADDVIPVILPIALDAPKQLTLKIEAFLADGATIRTEATFQVTPAPTARPQRWQPIGSDPALANTEAVREERSRLDAILQRASHPAHLWRGPFGLPVRGAILASFGENRVIADADPDAIGEEAPVHRGIDFALRAGASVLATADGMVLAVETLPTLGPTVFIDHGLGVVTCYAHIEPGSLQIGDGIRAEQVIGVASDAGLTDRVMLHYAIFVQGHAVDPESWQRLPRWLELPVDPALLPPPRAARRNPTATPPAPGDLWPSAVTAIAETVATPQPADQPGSLDAPLEEPGSTRSTDDLVELLRVQLPLRLPQVEAEVTMAESALAAAALAADPDVVPAALDGSMELETMAPETMAPEPVEDVNIEIHDRHGMRFAPAAQAILLLVGELVGPVKSETARLTIVDTKTRESVPVLLRDAHKFWRSQQGLAAKD